MKKFLFLVVILLKIISSQEILMAQKNYSLKFNVNNYSVQTTVLNGKTIKVRAFESLVYVSNPIDTLQERLNIYVPEDYFEGKQINGYSTETAPIFFPNHVGGYMPADPARLTENSVMHPGMKDERISTVVVALSKGYVVASAGARGRTSKAADGKYTGKAPAALVDLKAAIRYLKYNDKLMPGDANKIISNGTSAGGAMSTLLGATGNHSDYEPYLKSLGAAPATDDIFAVSAYCPITNLENADQAYEWQFNGYNKVERRGPFGNQGTTTLDAKQLEVSKQLKDLFPIYLNGLKLKGPDGKFLTLDNSGNGSFKEWVKSFVIASAQKALDNNTSMSKYGFLTIQNGKVTSIDFDGYVNYIARQKTPPAFDALDLSTPENQEFGTEKTDKQHFTEFSFSNSVSNGKMADPSLVRMLNPMFYIGSPQAKTAKHWRIRHGSKDTDTGLAIPVILATYLQNKGYDVNLELPWDKPHSGDYDLDELFNWMDSLCKK